jgi:hypothetical protein
LRKRPPSTTLCVVQAVRAQPSWPSHLKSLHWRFCLRPARSSPVNGRGTPPARFWPPPHLWLTGCEDFRRVGMGRSMGLLPRSAPESRVVRGTHREAAENLCAGGVYLCFTDTIFEPRQCQLLRFGDGGEGRGGAGGLRHVGAAATGGWLVPGATIDTMGSA